VVDACRASKALSSSSNTQYNEGKKERIKERKEKK
jgi:hypothetical protein